MNGISQTDDLRVTRLNELESPSDLMKRFPLSGSAATTVAAARNGIRGILTAEDSRALLVVEGLGEPGGALPIRALADLFVRYSEAVLVVLLVPSESKPDRSHELSLSAPSIKGLFEIQRRTLLELNEGGIPASTVLEDTISPQYFSDLLSWAMVPIWATESQVHRELASGVSYPVCFCARDSSTLKLAVDAIETAACSHHFVGLSKRGLVAMVNTAGNSDCTVLLQSTREGAEELGRAEAAEYLNGRGVVNRPVHEVVPGQPVFQTASRSHGRLTHIDVSSLEGDDKGAEQWTALETYLIMLSEGAVESR